MESTYAPGPPAFLEGQRTGTYTLERKHNQKHGRDAARSAQAEGRLGNQHASVTGRMVRFAGAHGGALARGGRTARWGAGEARGGGAGAAAD